MHDLDRMNMTDQELEFEQNPVYDEFEFEFEDNDPQYENRGDEEWEWEFEYEFEDNAYRGGLSEEEEYELASELLGSQTDEEMDYFLRKAFRRGLSFVKRKARNFVRSPRGRRLLGGLKSIGKRVARRALGAAGTYFGGPAGGAIANRLGGMLGLELEGMSPEDQEFEVAKRVVRFNTDLARAVASAPSHIPESEVLRIAAKKAAAKHLPGLVNNIEPGTKKQSGQWYRKGNRIVLTGL